MKTGTYVPRHRQARRPAAPMKTLTGSMPTIAVRGAAIASVAGLAITAAASSMASAAPLAAENTPLKSAIVPSSLTEIPLKATVPSIAWDAGDEAEPELSTEAPTPTPVGARVSGVATANVSNAQIDQAETVAQPASRGNSRATIDKPTYTPVAENPSGSDVVSIALSFRGVPYVFGGTTPAGFDCSGFTQYVYAKVGKQLPRTAEAQGYAGTFVPASEAKPGDLVWHAYGHVGIYIGNGQVVEATQPGELLHVNPLWGSYQFVRV